MEVSTIFTYYATYANEIKLVYIRVELSTISLIMQLVQMKGGTQGAIFMCYITMEPKLYNPVSWDFAIVQNEGNFIQYSGYSYTVETG